MRACCDSYVARELEDTVSRVRLRSSGRSGSLAYVRDAERQLELARMELRADQAVVYSYRAALRAAGAVIHAPGSASLRKKGGSAWEKLLQVRPDTAEWVEDFRAIARLASRADMGLEKSMPEQQAQSIYVRACEFVDYVRGELNYLPHVA